MVPIPMHIKLQLFFLGIGAFLFNFTLEHVSDSCYLSDVSIAGRRSALPCLPAFIALFTSYIKCKRFLNCPLCLQTLRKVFPAPVPPEKGYMEFFGKKKDLGKQKKLD